MSTVNQPIYDEDLVNKAYVDEYIGKTSEKIKAEGFTKNFGSQPEPPYRVNDTYMNGTDIYICTKERLIGDFESSDWEKASNYTDNTLAESKNTVFNVQPTVPYRIGDLWTGGPNGELRRCIFTRSNGVYTESDWEMATTYDNTEVVVQNGLITAGTIQTVQGGVASAGITGNSSGDDAVRFWAGSTLANRSSAPFRVTQGGSVVASNMLITGGSLTWSNLNKPSKSDLGIWTTFLDNDGLYTGTLTANQVNAVDINADNITSGTLSTNRLNSDVITTSNFSAQNINANKITSGTITGRAISGGTITGTTITTTSGTIGGFTLGANSLSGSTSNGTMRIQRGTSPAIDFPCNGGRLMLSSSSGSANVALTSAGGSNTNGLCISDSYGHTGSGASGFSIGIRSIYGSTRIATASPYVVRLERTNGARIEVGANVSIQGGYTQIQSVTLTGNTFKGSGGAFHYSNANCMLSPASGYHAYVGSTAAANKIAVSSGGLSSKNVKKNIKCISDEEYKHIYEDLQKLKTHTFDYKYKNIKEEKSDFGFIIDEIEKLPVISKYTKHYTSNGFIRNKKFIPYRENDEKQQKYKKIEYKEWDRDSYIKTLLLMVKSMQIKIDELEKKIGGK